MAKEHFDEKGFPVFSKIVRPIVEFVEALTIEKGEDGRINIINPLNLAYTDKYVTKYIRPIDSNIEADSKPIKINGIYVVGSQAQRLPENYNIESDMDMLVQTNLEDLVIEPSATEQRVLYQLGKMLNNGKADWRNRGPEDKSYAIDLYEGGKAQKKRVDAPHLQIYPILRKVNAVEVPLSDEVRKWIQG